MSVEKTPVQSYVLKPMVSGLFAAGICYFAIGNEGTVPLMGGFEVSPIVAVGSSVAIASSLAAAVQQQLQAAQPDALADVSAMVIAPVLTGAAVLATSRLLIGPATSAGMGKLFLIGASAEVGSVYVSDSVLALLPNF
jgi:hypothetical protein